MNFVLQCVFDPIQAYHHSFVFVSLCLSSEAVDVYELLYLNVIVYVPFTRMVSVLLLV